MSSIALACLLAGADAFGTFSGPSHSCVLPDGDDAGAAGGGVIRTEVDLFCGRSEIDAQCKDMADSMVELIFGTGCDDLVCDGSMVVSSDPNPTIAVLIQAWCPKTCSTCGSHCEDKPSMLEANQAMFGTPAVPTCEAFSVPVQVPAASGTSSLDRVGDMCTEAEITATGTLPDCNDPSLTSGCCAWSDEAYTTNPTCEVLFRVACPSMSGICSSCPGGRRKLNAVADRATVGALLNSGSFKKIA